MTDTNWYTDHPLTTRDRRRSTSPHLWTSGFGCEDVRPLIVCRGPIRKEAMDVFEQMGITHYGMLLSEKDSIVYTQSLAPELRRMRPEHVHRVHDYTGANGEEFDIKVTYIEDCANIPSGLLADILGIGGSILLGALDACEVAVGEAKARPGVAEWSKIIGRGIARKNKKTTPEKLEFLKFDPKARKHVLYKEVKLK